MIHIEHHRILGKEALSIRWNTNRPILQLPIRRLTAVPLYSGDFTLADRGESNTVPCLAILSEDMKSGVGILVTKGDPNNEHLRLALVLGELHNRITSVEADAARRELDRAHPVQ